MSDLPVAAHVARDPIAAIASAPGRGAIGVIRVSGSGLQPLAKALLGRVMAPRVAAYGPFLDAADEAIDRGIAILFPAPHSYTGEDVLELQAHGGPVVLQLLLERVLEAGAETDAATQRPRLAHLRLARPGEFTERAFLNGKLDLAQAEAVMDLIDASTAAAARSAARSVAGAFSQEIGQLHAALVELRAIVEATLDFPEEDLDALQEWDVPGRLTGLQEALTQLRGRVRQGVLLRDGIRVVIAGQPNVGKSSLLNALAGADLAIVTDVAGTTRDVLRHAMNLDGVPLHVLDTAGLRDGTDAVERIGVARAWEQIAEADAVLWVRDLSRCGAADYDSADERIRGRLSDAMPPQVPLLELWNKSDLAPDAVVPADALCIAARTGQGLSALRARLLALAGWQGGSGEGLFSARARHLEALAQVDSRLGDAASLLRNEPLALDLLAEELRLAQNTLGRITGEFTADDLLGIIFSRFCIGK